MDFFGNFNGRYANNARETNVVVRDNLLPCAGVSYWCKPVWVYVSVIACICDSQFRRT